MASKAAITSLTILKVNWDTLKKDYVENFVPFVVECLRTGPDDVVSLPQLQEALRNELGLALPLNPLRQILQRAAKHGYIHRQAGVFHRDGARCSQLNFPSRRRLMRIALGRSPERPAYEPVAHALRSPS